MPNSPDLKIHGTSIFNLQTVVGNIQIGWGGRGNKPKRLLPKVLRDGSVIGRVNANRDRSYQRFFLWDTPHRIDMTFRGQTEQEVEAVIRKILVAIYG